MATGAGRTAGSPTPVPTVPTSSAQRAAAEDGTSVPPPELVRERLWAVGVPMPPGQRGLAYTLCYVLQDDDDRLHVVDPGTDSPENRTLLLAALDSLAPGAPVASVVVTHLHPDHLGMAAWLRERAGAALVLHEREVEATHRVGEDDPGAPGRWGVPQDRREELAAVRSRRPGVPVVDVDVALRGEQDRLDVPGWDVRALLTPGHTPGSTCLHLPQAGVVVTGDHVLPQVFPGLGLGGRTGSNPVTDYLAALDRVAALGDPEVLPGHGYRFRGLAARCTAIGDHHRRRTDEVARVLADRPDATVWEVATGLTWSAGWPALHGFLLLSALHQTALHVDLLARRSTPRP